MSDNDSELSYEDSISSHSNDSSIGDATTVQEESETEDDENETPQTSYEIEPTFIFGDQRNKKNKFITKFEYCGLIGKRADQIEKNNPPPHEMTKSHPDAYKMTFALDIAKFELDNPDIPFPVVLLRNIGGSVYEVWENIRELELPLDVQMERKMGVKPYEISSFNFLSDI